MAMQVPDLTKGLRPFGSPRTELVLDFAITDDEVIDCYAPVAIASGKISAAADTTDAANLAGVALGYAVEADGDTHVPVCIDPMQLYSVLLVGAGQTPAVAQTYVGLYAKLEDLGVAAINGYSQCQIDAVADAPAAAPSDADFHVQIVGLDPSVDQENAAAGEVRVLVRLNNPKFKGSDAVA